ncbi:MAG: hypothetical protein JWM27_3494 [Gemmatimonadetes bacterium]|nr:hypothetical protein [Gemmatimonadota bacterium]
MTIAISLVVGDGVVLGTDSATSIVLPGERYHNIYSNAEKTINLVKGLPIGLMTWGLGSMAGTSIASLARVLRDLLSGEDEDVPGWEIDRRTYTMEEVAGLVKTFFYDQLYVSHFGQPSHAPGTSDGDTDQPPIGPAPERPSLGFVLAGFSANAYLPEVWTIEVHEGGVCEGPTQIVPAGQTGIVRFWAQPEALYRLVYGWSAEAHDRLVEAGLTHEAADAILVSETQLAHPGMPIQDAIDLVKYLADVTAGYLRFKPGAPVVGPPIDIAAITRHQGFKWVSRKHYYPGELNPVDPPRLDTPPPNWRQE